MSNPFNVPDEVVQGLFGSAQDFFSAMSVLPTAPAFAQAVITEAAPQYWQRQWALWTGVLNNFSGANTQAVTSPVTRDQRFMANE